MDVGMKDQKKDEDEKTIQLQILYRRKKSQGDQFWSFGRLSVAGPTDYDHKKILILSVYQQLSKIKDKIFPNCCRSKSWSKYGTINDLKSPFRVKWNDES